MSSDPTPEITSAPCEATQTAFSANPDRVVFTALLDNNTFQIFSSDSNGDNIIQLTDTEHGNYHPELSPSGNLIAFNSSRDGNFEIYLMNADGTNQVRLTYDDGNDFLASWSPDESTLVFTSRPTEIGDVPFGIYSISVDGSGLQQLTDRSGNDFDPAWSPDGCQIAFVSMRSGLQEIHLMNPDGSNVIQVTHSPTTDTHFNRLSWSPDGTMIAARSSDNQLYRVNRDGSDLYHIVSLQEGYIIDFAWLNNEQIIFSTSASDLMLINIDGTGRTPLGVRWSERMGLFSIPMNWNPAFLSDLSPQEQERGFEN